MLAIEGQTNLALPRPAADVGVREATTADVAFMDALQKANGRALGWFPTKQFEGYVEMRAVLVAESGGRAVGYVIARDRYGGRDDVGAVYQLAVSEDARRRNVGARLVEAALARAAYGCRLFCCWCAQDLAANEFWQAMGFVPIAYRTGSRTKQKGKPRLHVLWQRRVNAGDVATPYWYPYQTRGGAIREDRLVFPLTPGERWDAAKPVVLPEHCRKPAELEAAERKAIEDGSSKKKTAAKEKAEARAAAERAEAEQWTTIFVGGKLKKVRKPGQQGIVAPPPPPAPEPVVAEARAEKRRPMKHEVAATEFCRELRDRWRERVREEPWMLESAGAKYDVGRSLPGRGDDRGEGLEPKLLSNPAKLLSAA